MSGCAGEQASAARPVDARVARVVEQEAVRQRDERRDRLETVVGGVGDGVGLARLDRVRHRRQRRRALLALGVLPGQAVVVPVGEVLVDQPEHVVCRVVRGGARVAQLAEVLHRLVRPAVVDRVPPREEDELVEDGLQLGGGLVDGAHHGLPSLAEAAEHLGTSREIARDAPVGWR